MSEENLWFGFVKGKDARGTYFDGVITAFDSDGICFGIFAPDPATLRKACDIVDDKFAWDESRFQAMSIYKQDSGKAQLPFTLPSLAQAQVFVPSNMSASDFDSLIARLQECRDAITGSGSEVGEN